MPAGRRPIAIPIEQVEALAARGLTQSQIADALGISLATIQRRRQDNEEFDAALKKGQATGIAAVANKLMERINGGDVTAMIFFLKTRAGWKETQVIEAEIRPAHFVAPHELTPEAWAEMQSGNRVLTRQ
jgi:hypothetical protein